MDLGKQVLVELSPSCVGVARLLAGRCVEARRARVDTREASDSSGTVAIWREALRRMVGEMGLAGLRATVVLTSPDVFVGAYACSLKAGKAAARRAAALALGEAASLDVQTSPHALCAVHVDGPQSGSLRQVHTLGQVASESHVGLIASLVNGVGLRFQGLVSAAFLAAMSGIDVARAHPAGALLVAHVGDHESILLGMSAGRLRFVRQAPLGVESLIQALTREPLDCVDSDPVKLDAGAARELLARTGIPAPGEGVGLGSNQNSTAVLPRLQACLQRMALEARQSLRFGFAEDERASVTLAVVGGGATTPRLGEVLGEMSGLKVAAVGATPITAGLSPGIAQYLSLRKPDALIAPRAVINGHIERALRQGLWVGAAAAVLVLAGVLANTRAKLVQVHQRIATLTGEAGNDEALRDLTARMQAIGARLEEATGTLASELGQSAPWSGAMVAIAGALPDGVRVTSMDMRMGDRANRCQLAGVAKAGPGREAPTLIREFMDRLAAMPIVSGCRLESTSKVGAGEGGVQFQIEVDVIGLPGLALAPEGDAEGDG